TGVQTCALPILGAAARGCRSAWPAPEAAPRRRAGPPPGPPPSAISLCRFPSLGPLECLAPADLEPLALHRLHRGRKAAVHLPLRRDLFLVFPVAHGQSGEIGRAQRRR